MDVYVDGVRSTNVNLEANPQTEVTIIGDPQTSVDVAEEEKIGIEVEQEEPVDVKIDGQIYEVGGGNGQDGFSPIVEVEEIEGGHRVTITDVEGTKVFDVLNGRNGRDGVDGYTPIKGVDYFTDSDKKEIKQEISSIYDVDGNGQVDKADDSDKLGGQLPSYYATKEQLKSKADLVDGKVPLSQLPDNIGGGVTSWNDLKDKPFYDTRTSTKITIDVTNMPKVSSRPIEELDGMSITVVKASDEYIAPNDMLGSIIDYNTGSGGVLNFVVENKNLVTCDVGFYVAYVYDEGDADIPVCFSVPTSCTLKMLDGLIIFDVEQGLYFLHDEMLGTSVNYFEKTGGELKTLDIKYLPQNMALGYEDKAFEDIVFDGNTDGLEFVSLDLGDMVLSWYRVSDKFVPLSNMIGAVYLAPPITNPEGVFQEKEFSDYDIQISSNGSYYYDISFISVSEPNTTLDLDGIEVMFPSEGIWFVQYDFGDGAEYIKYLKSPNQIVQLDEKFIPDTIARKSDLKKIDLSNYYNKSDIDNKFSELDLALSSAIGNGVLE